MPVPPRYRRSALWSPAAPFHAGCGPFPSGGLRATFEGLGYKFKYVYDIIGKKTRSDVVADYCQAAITAKQLLTDKVGMAGYRDMNLYGTLYDGLSLKKETGVEIETFEMLEIQQRYEKLTEEEKRDVVNNRILKWNFLKPANDDAMMMAAGYYLAVKQIAEERNVTVIELNKMAEQDRSIDDLLDNKTTELGKTLDNVVFDSRLAWNFVPESFKVFLLVDTEEAARRVFQDSERNAESYENVQQAKEGLVNRANLEKERFKDFHVV
mgnify:CR=1 FL=1